MWFQRQLECAPMPKTRILLHDPVDARLTCLGFSHALRMNSVDVNLPDATRPSACVLAHALVMNQGFQLTPTPWATTGSATLITIALNILVLPFVVATSCSQLSSY